MSDLSVLPLRIKKITPIEVIVLPVAVCFYKTLFLALEEQLKFRLNSGRF
jgi:hypothetical protein